MYDDFKLKNLFSLHGLNKILLFCVRIIITEIMYFEQNMI